MNIAISNTLERIGIIGILRHAMAARSGLVLALHRVLPVEERAHCYDPHLALSETAFVSLLRLLRHDYDVVPLHGLLANPRGSGGRPKVALTFDDGWEDTFRVAFPHLLAFNMPATIFVCAELVNTSSVLPEERFARLWNQCASQSRTGELTADLQHWGMGKRKRAQTATEKRYWSQELKRMPIAARLLLLDHLEERYEIVPVQSARFLRWEDMRAMMQTDLVSVGSHTCRHSTLTSEMGRDIRRELEESRTVIHQHTGVLPNLLAYPNGMYNRQVIDRVRTAGFQAAVATHPGLPCRTSNRFCIPRIAIDDTTVTDANLHLSPSRTSAYFVSSWLRSAASIQGVCRRLTLPAKNVSHSKGQGLHEMRVFMRLNREGKTM
ncbi:MAG: polysaccharide deacetylase family protein [Acidobacteriaceae bacterium]